MKLKIDKKIQRDLNEIAENEFCPVETIIKRGLKIFIDYYAHKDISEYLKSNKVDVVIENYKKELDMTDNELIFAIIEAYRYEILGMSVKERLKLNGNEIGTETYVFKDMPIEGKSVYLAIKEKSLNDYLKEFAEENEMQNQDKVRDFIKEAERQLKVLEQSYSILDKQKQEYVNTRAKLVAEVRVLKATEIFKLDHKARAEHIRKISKKEHEAATISKPLEDIKENMKGLKNRMFYVKEDIEEMKGLFETSPIQVGKLKDKYNPDPTKYPIIEKTW